MQTNSDTGGKHGQNRSTQSGLTGEAKPVAQDTGVTPLFKSASVQALSILTAAEVRELVACEEVIGKGWDTFINVGRSLTTIRDKRLYRADFESFEMYCRHKWHYGKSHAYRLIGAAEVISCLSPVGDIPLPRHEAQVRPLLGLKADEVRAVWREVVIKAGDKNATAKLVKDTVARLRLGATAISKPLHASTRRDAQRLIALVEKFLNSAKQALNKGDVSTAFSSLEQLSRRLRAGPFRLDNSDKHKHSKAS
jgi:hypothetical protein